MITLNVAYCEDLPADAALLKRYIADSGIPAELAWFESGEACIRSFCAGKYDLIFMDIYMGDVSGIDTVKAIRKIDSHVVIAFITNSPDHTRESYQLKALRYLDKPVSAADVKEAMELALMKRKTRPAITVTASGGKQTEIAVHSIIYFEQQNRVVRIHLPDSVLVTSQSARMNEFEKLLPSPPFVRCHQSFLVNLSYVHKVNREIPAFLLKNGESVYIRQRDIGQCAKYEKMLDMWRMSQAARGDI